MQLIKIYAVPWILINMCDNKSETELSNLGKLGDAVVFFKRSSIPKGFFQSIIYDGLYKEEKVLVKRFPRKFEDVKSLQDEILLVCKVLSFEHILKYCTGSLDDELFYAMERCDTNLEVRISENNLPPCRLNILHQILLGLRFLHEHKLKVVHGNLKPTNVLFKSGTVKLSDFGMAHLYSELRKQFVKDGVQLGIFDWMAPEIIQCYLDRNYKPELTFASDVFSAGCVFYYCISNGIHPFGRPLERAHNILENENLINNDLLSEKNAPSFVCSMLSHCNTDRPTTATILEDPLFLNLNHPPSSPQILEDAETG